MAKGRVKDFGVPWSPEEHASLVAIAQSTNVSFAEVAPYIRTHGPLEVDAFLAIREGEGDEKPDAHKTRKELEKKAKALKVEFLPEITDRALAELVKEAEEAANAPASAPAATDPATDPAAPAAPAVDPAAPATPVAEDPGAAAPLPSREDLEKRAGELGLKVTANMKDSTIAARIKEAEEADKGN